MAQFRNRYYGCIVYPESAPDDWMQILEDSHVPAMISPLHDRDRVHDKEDGELKKPHFHVLVFYSSTKSADQARELFKTFGGVGCESIQNIKGSVRYLSHLDNTKKIQYDEGEIICLSGADYLEYRDRPGDRYAIIAEMIDWCDSNCCYSFSELVSYSRSQNELWFRALCDNSAYIMEKYLKSALWTAMQLDNKVSSHNLSLTTNSEEQV